MKRSVRFGIIGAVLFVGLALIAAGLASVKAMPVGTGFVAESICASTFISHRDPQTVFREEVAPVNPLARLVHFDIDHAAKSVRATALGLFPMTAIYRQGCGCTLVVGTTEAKMRAQKLVPPGFDRTHPSRRPDLPWPDGGLGPVDPAALGVDTALLRQAVDRAFAEPGHGKKRNTHAVLVVYRGQLIAERYAPGFNKDMPLIGWSMSKSITNALVGVLVGEGKLDIKQPAPVPEWRHPGDARQAITLDQLLRMSSGLRFSEVYAPFFDVTRMLFDSRDFAAYAAEQPLEAPPDTRWSYSSGSANIVARVVRQTLAPAYPYYYTALYKKFFDRIGMTSVILEPDPSGTFVGSSYVFATARDWARFGLLYLQDGVWRGQRILPEGWVRYTTTPTPAAPKGEYGAFFWLNAGAPHDPHNRRWPDAPRDAFAAEGYQEQKVIIIPSKSLVLVRLGATTDRKAWDTNAFIRDVLAALPNGS